MRQFEGKASWAIGALYVGFAAWSIYGAIWPVETYAFRMVHMAFIFALAFLVYPYRPNAGRWTLAPDLILALLGGVRSGARSARTENAILEGVADLNRRYPLAY